MTFDYVYNFVRNQCIDLVKDTNAQILDIPTPARPTFETLYYSQVWPKHQLKYVLREYYKVLGGNPKIWQQLGHSKINTKDYRRLLGIGLLSYERALISAFYSSKSQPIWNQTFRVLSRTVANKPAATEYLAQLVWDAIYPEDGKFDKSWRTSDVMGLVQEMRKTENFGLMPLLADALQEAGCDLDAWLDHLRSSESRFSLGSWVFRVTGVL